MTMTPDSVPIAEQEDPEIETEPLRIMLLGKSGAGKSSSGNTILGRAAFRSDMKLARVTRYCERECGVVDDVPVSVMDTPGLFETDREEKEIVREIMKCVKLQEPGPHAFAVVVPVGRMTVEDQQTNERIEAKFGPRVWDYTVVLFTHGDRLEGKTINDVITNSEENLRDFIRKCSGGFHVFDNKNHEDQEQVSGFVSKVRTLVAVNGGTHYRTDFYPEEERRIRARQESILATRDDEIRVAERDLEERHQGEELEKKRKALWRSEEEKARKKAESEPTAWSRFVTCIKLMLAGAVLCHFLLRGMAGEYMAMVIGGIGGICVMFREHLFVSVKRRFGGTANPD